MHRARDRPTVNILYYKKYKERKMIRKWILRLLFGEDSQSWKEMFRIAVECNETSKRTLRREAYMLGRYGAIVDRENQILDAVKNSYDFQLKLRVLEILNGNSEEEE